MLRKVQSLFFPKINLPKIEVTAPPDTPEPPQTFKERLLLFIDGPPKINTAMEHIEENPANLCISKDKKKHKPAQRPRSSSVPPPKQQPNPNTIPRIPPLPSFRPPSPPSAPLYTVLPKITYDPIVLPSRPLRTNEEKRKLVDHLSQVVDDAFEQSLSDNYTDIAEKNEWKDMDLKNKQDEEKDEQEEAEDNQENK